MAERHLWNVLLIEHNAEDVRVFERALAAPPPLPGRLQVVTGIQEAIRSINEGISPAPSLVLFNTRSPLLTDAGVIAGLRGLRRVTGVPVLLFVDSADRRQVADAYRSYAAACSIVPEDRQRFESMLRDALEYWLTRVLLPHPADSRPPFRDEPGESPRPS